MDTYLRPQKVLILLHWVWKEFIITGEAAANTKNKMRQGLFTFKERKCKKLPCHDYVFPRGSSEYKKRLG